jgi:hypothetical protein
MSISDADDRSLPSFLQVMREVMPRVPWRAAGIWGIALGSTFVIREIYDIFNPTIDWGPRSLASTVAALTVCFGAGFYAVWRSRQLLQGIAVTMVAIVIGFLVAIVGNETAVLVIYPFHRLDLANELASALEVPLPVMLVIGGLAGTAGAAIAVYLTRFRNTTVMQS